MSYLDALQATLAAEHAAVYVYAFLGAQTSESGQPQLSADLAEAFAVHLGRRNDLVSAVLAQDGDPVASKPAYALPGARDARAVAKSAVQVESACAATYDFLVANAPSERRRAAIGLLVDAATRQLRFGGAPAVFPGR